MSAIRAVCGRPCGHRGLPALAAGQCAPADRLRDVSEASPQLENAVDRAGRFLTLASLVSVLLCSIAVAMSARQYVRRHLDAVALLKTLGATRGFTLSVSLLQLVMVALLASVAGIDHRVSRAGMAAARGT